MNKTLGDYYALTAEGYTRIGMMQLPGADKMRQLSIYKTTNEFMNRSRKDPQTNPETIKEVEQEHDLLNPHKSTLSLQAHKEKPEKTVLRLLAPRTRMMDKEEVDSIHLDDSKTAGNCSKETQHNISKSLISSINTVAKRGKRSLNEMYQTQMNSQHDSQELLLELNSEKKLRLKIEQSYKQLLKQLQKSQKHLSQNLTPTFHQQLMNSPSFYEQTSSRRVKKILDLPQDDPEEDAKEERYDQHKNTMTQRKYVRMARDNRASYDNSRDVTEVGGHSKAQSCCDQGYEEGQLQFQNRALYEIECVKERIAGLQAAIIERDRRQVYEKMSREIKEKEKALLSCELQNNRLKIINEVLAGQQKTSEVTPPKLIMLGGLLYIILLLLVLSLSKEVICK